MKLDNDQCKELCLKLLHAETEKEVEQILKQYKLWDYKDADDNWRLLGDSPANWSVAGNQQAKPVPSLVEKLVKNYNFWCTDWFVKCTISVGKIIFRW